MNVLLFILKFQLYTVVVGFFLKPQTDSLSKKNLSSEITPCEINIMSATVSVNCSNRSLKSIDSSWFPENTSDLMLQSNQLTVIPNNTLNHMYQLERLSIQDNLLTTIESNAFQGLTNLQYLNLENNTLDLFDLSVDTFNDLSTLTELRIAQREKNEEHVKKSLLDSNSSFPDNIFSTLNNLTTLSVSVFNRRLFFNKDFSKLMKLSTVQISGSVQIIDENSFKHIKHVQHIETLNLKQINNFSDLAFENFTNLDHINLSFTFIGLHKALNTLRPLANSKLKTLYFYLVQTTPGLKYVSLQTRDGILDVASTHYLRQICINEIHIIKSAIFLIEKGAFGGPVMNRCLKSLNLLNNPLVGTLPGLINIFTCKSISSIVITGSCVRRNGLSGNSNVLNTNLLNYLVDSRESNQESHNSLANTETTLSNYLVHSWESNQESHNSSSLAYTETALSNYLVDSRESNQESYNSSSLAYTDTALPNMSLEKGEVIIDISSSIVHLELSSIIRETFFNRQYRLRGGENLRHLRLIDDGLTLLMYSILGLEQLKILELSYNWLYSLSADFFNAYVSLEQLSIDNCQLRNEFMSVHSAHMFKNLTNLQHLDISYNDLEILAPKTFLTNAKLTYLNIAGNCFREIPFDLKLTPRLQVLNLRNNIFTTISETERKTFDVLRDRLGNFHLLLSGNILSCGCDNLPFLIWLQLTSIQLDENGNYTCINDEARLTYTLAYVDLDGLWRQCWAMTFFNISIGLLCLTLIGFFLVFIWYKNKTFITSVILKVFSNFKLKTLTDYKYGVFIGYSDLDYQFACFILRRFIEDELGLTTFLNDRDLSPSMAFAEGIMDGINSSWRILLLINDDFLDEDNWFLFTIRSAVYSMNPANPNRVVILVEDKNRNRLPHELMSSVPEDNIKVISEWVMTYELKQTLRTRLLQ